MGSKILHSSAAPYRWKTKIQSEFIVLLSVAAWTFICESSHAQNQYRGLDAQRGAVMGNAVNTGTGYSASSAAQTAQDSRNAAATAENNQGLDACTKEDWATAEADFQQALQNNPTSPVFLRNLAITLAHEGEDAFKRGDSAKALKYFEKAVANDPASDASNQHIRDDLAYAQGKIADDQRQQEQRQQDKITANNIQQSIQTLAQSFRAAPLSGGLDFLSEDTKPQAKSGLEFGDPMIVDARNVPSGLPKAVDDAIATAYPNTSDRIRKGFQAVMTHDWKVAKAWFGDALNQDPGDPGLKELVALADYSTEHSQQANAASTPPDAKNTEKVLAGVNQKLDSAADDQLKTQLNDFYQNYLPKHPELMNPQPSAASAQTSSDSKSETVKPTPMPQSAELKANWQVLFDSCFKTVPRDKRPTSVSAVRD